MYKTTISLTLAILIAANCFGSSFLKKEENNKCATATGLQNTIMQFINYGDKTIYEKEFLAAFAQNNENPDCYFPTTKHEKKVYYFLGDSSLVQDVQSDERAMALLIDLYLLNQDNTELTEFYGSSAIPKAVTVNPGAFVKVLSGKSESEADKCIDTLQNVSEKKRGKIRNEIAQPGKAEYLPVIQKMREALQ